jgi:hypothetical protein
VTGWEDEEDEPAAELNVDMSGSSMSDGGGAHSSICSFDCAVVEDASECADGGVCEADTDVVCAAEAAGKVLDTFDVLTLSEVACTCVSRAAKEGVDAELMTMADAACAGAAAVMSEFEVRAVEVVVIAETDWDCNWTEALLELAGMICVFCNWS